MFLGALRPQAISWPEDGPISHWTDGGITAIGFFIIPFSPISQFGREASSRKSHGCFKLIPFKNFGGLCALGNRQNSFQPSPDLCLTQSCLWALQAVYSTSWLGFCSFALICTVWPYIERCVPFQIMSNQLNLPQVDSNQGVETSKKWSREMRGTWTSIQTICYDT